MSFCETGLRCYDRFICSLPFSRKRGGVLGWSLRQANSSQLQSDDFHIDRLAAPMRLGMTTLYLVGIVAYRGISQHLSPSSIKMPLATVILVPIINGLSFFFGWEGGNHKSGRAWKPLAFRGRKALYPRDTHFLEEFALKETAQLSFRTFLNGIFLMATAHLLYRCVKNLVDADAYLTTLPEEVRGPIALKEIGKFFACFYVGACMPIVYHALWQTQGANP